MFKVLEFGKNIPPAPPASAIPIVSLKQGQIFGKSDVLPRTGKPYIYFRGIPYAEPPVGKLRFQVSESQVVNPWMLLQQI